MYADLNKFELINKQFIAAIHLLFTTISRIFEIPIGFGKNNS
jgi:hypothetical protein